MTLFTTHPAGAQTRGPAGHKADFVTLSRPSGVPYISVWNWNMSIMSPMAGEFVGT